MSDIYDIKTYQSRGSIGYLINRARVELLDALDQELAQFDVTAAQYIIIGTLAEGHADSASQICRGISYDPGAMTRMLDRLEQRGLIRRVRLTDDRRSVKLELTAEGKAIYPRMRACSVTVLNRFLRGFTKAEAHQLESLLQRMLANA